MTEPYITIHIDDDEIYSSVELCAPLKTITKDEFKKLYPTEIDSEVGLVLNSNGELIIKECEND